MWLVIVFAIQEFGGGFIFMTSKFRKKVTFL